MNSTDIPVWQSDGLGSLARIGVLTPDNDPVPESEMWAMAPRGVSIHASRIRWNGDARSLAEPPHVDTAAELLSGLKPDVIVYAFTGSSYLLGVEADDSLRARLEARACAVPVILTAPAASEALRCLGVHRLALIHPPWFTDQVNAKGPIYFQARGFSVISCARMIPARSFMEVSPAEVYDWCKEHVSEDAEAVFIGGNGMRAIGAIHALEKALAMPVLTANQVGMWQALRLVGLTAPIPEYGRIFRERVTQQQS